MRSGTVGRGAGDGGEGANRTLLSRVDRLTAVLKTARATRHPSLSPRRLRSPFLGTARRTHFGHQEVVIRKLPRRLLRPHQPAVHRHLESAPGGRDEFQGGDLKLERQQFRRQTDGVRLVVSSRAILDGDLQSHSARHPWSLRSSGQASNGTESPRPRRQRHSARTHVRGYFFFRSVAAVVRRRSLLRFRSPRSPTPFGADITSAATSSFAP